MAYGDIMPWVSPLGGTYEVRWGIMTASETFECGEPVGVAAGAVTEPPDDGTEWLLADVSGTGLICGIACFGPGAGNLNPATGVAFATGDDIAYWPAGQGNLFITEYFFATGAAAYATPDADNIGVIYQITSGTDTGVENWGVEETAGTPGTDVLANVVEVLDSMKRPIRISGQDGAYVVFEILVDLG